MLYKLKVIMKITSFLLVSVVVGGQLQAGEVVIKKVVFEHQAGVWTVATTLLHQAQAGSIMPMPGERSMAKAILGTRKLFHPHVDEQPFTRSLGDIKIPANLEIVTVEAHDKKHGWSVDKVEVQLSQKQGDRFTVIK